MNVIFLVTWKNSSLSRHVPLLHNIFIYIHLPLSHLLFDNNLYGITKNVHNFDH